MEALSGPQQWSLANVRSGTWLDTEVVVADYTAPRRVGRVVVARGAYESEASWLVFEVTADPDEIDAYEAVLDGFAPRTFDVDLPTPDIPSPVWVPCP